MFIKMLIKYKKGSEEAFSVWWLFSIVLIAITFFFWIGYFYSSDTDVREEEAKILSDKLFDCLVEGGFVKAIDEVDVFSDCDLNEKLFDESLSFKITLNDKIVKTNDFDEVLCKVQEAKSKAENYPKCLRKERVVFYNDGDEIKTAELEILTASNYQGEALPLT